MARRERIRADLGLNAKALVAFLTALLIALLIACPFAMAGPAPGTPRIGSLLPSVMLSRATGAPVRIPDHFRGKVLVLHFWQIGCSSCRADMPAMDGLYRRYRGRGLEIVAVNVGQEAGAVKAYAVGLGVSYPIVMDPSGKSASAYGVVDVPRTYIVDRSGVVRYRILGGATQETLTRLITSLF
jgi:thiol-disulfide isomerase/thioredoxin